MYRIDTDGKVVEVTHEVEKPNGLALSPDGKTLYLADHNNGTDRIDPNGTPPKKGAMKVYAFPLGPDGLVNGARKTIVDFGEEDGSDGMRVDAAGRVYLAARQLSAPAFWSSIRRARSRPSSRPASRTRTASPPRGSPATASSASATT